MTAYFIVVCCAFCVLYVFVLTFFTLSAILSVETRFTRGTTMSGGVLPASLLHDVIIAASARRPTISSSIHADPTHLRSLFSSSNDMDMVASSTSTITPGGRSAALFASLKPRLGGMDGSIAGRKLGDSIEWGGVLSPASVNHHTSAVAIPAKFSRSQTVHNNLLHGF